MVVELQADMEEEGVVTIVVVTITTLVEVDMEEEDMLPGEVVSDMEEEEIAMEAVVVVTIIQREDMGWELVDMEVEVAQETETTMTQTP